MTTVLEAILAATNDFRVRASMALGALLEGGSLGIGPFPAGDQGTSLGPFQIHLPAHPGVTRAQAQDPTSATAFMLSEYSSAVRRIPESLWTTDPERAAEKAAMLAERPAKDYYTSRPGAVQKAWATVTSVLGIGASTDSPPAGGSAVNVIGPELPNVEDFTKLVTKLAIIGPVVLAGAGLILLGLNKATGNPVAKVAKVAL